MSLGWTGKILRVDLTQMKSWVEETELYNDLKARTLPPGAIRWLEDGGRKADYPDV